MGHVIVFLFNSLPHECLCGGRIEFHWAGELNIDKSFWQFLDECFSTERKLVGLIWFGELTTNIALAKVNQVKKNHTARNLYTI